MKDRLKTMLSVLSKIKSYLLFIFNGSNNNKVGIPPMFYKSSYSFNGSGNSLAVSGQTEKSSFFIDGSGNTIGISNSLVENAIITVTGNNNNILCEDGVKLRNSTITIRGNSCNIKIGKDTSFGGVRIINAGKNNDVVIGSCCLFSDFIEIWASDTHPVYNEAHEIINSEKPIFIQDNVWVGARAIILKGVTIEKGSVVGMGSLVVNNVPKASITVGSPNRIVKDNISWALHY